MKKQDATQATGAAFDSLFEAKVLRDVAEYILQNHDDCDDARTQLDVLRNIADERVTIALDLIDAVDDYFNQKLNKRKKPAIVKKAA